MAEHMAAEITIGGKVPAGLVGGLCRAITKQRVSLEWGEPAFEPVSAEDLIEACRDDDNHVRVLRVFDDQASWGQFEWLEHFLQDNGIAYTRRSEGRYDFDPERVDFRPGEPLRTQPTNTAGEMVVAVSCPRCPAWNRLRSSPIVPWNNPMGDSYLTFSEVLAQLSTEEEAWLKSQLEPVSFCDGKELAENAEQGPDWEGPRFLRDFEDPDADSDVDSQLSFQYAFHDDEGLPNAWGRHLWLFAEEYGNPEQVAHLVQKFLQVFRPQDCWSLTYSVTCSKLRAGHFGGGATFVTAGSILRCDSHGFVRAQEQAFSQTKSKDHRDVQPSDDSPDPI